MFPIRILPAGDSALVVSLPQVIDPEINAWCVTFAEAARDRWGSALRDVVVGYCSVTAYFDPLQVDPAWLEAELASFARGMRAAAVQAGETIDVPVVYGGAAGPDLETVAQFAGCPESEVVARHTAVSYRVYLVGFVPGFAYMATVDPVIAAPRRATPRIAVPAGSVAIAGGQTGIYPDTTPGGWNIIGRTSLKPFDATRPDPALFKPGDQVRFHAVEVLNP
jgi:KipI family sensor histidine kinase inhibitor